MSLVGLGSLLILGSFAVLREELLDWWYPVPVVRTWADLLGGAPLRLDQGSRAWIGIEAKRCPQWSGVLLYCLVEDYHDATNWPASAPGTLRISFEGESENADRVFMARGSSDIASGDSKLLFLRSIPVLPPRNKRIRILTTDGKLLGRVTVEGTPSTLPPWLPLAESKIPPDRRRPSLGLAGIKAAPALPSWDGLVPFPERETKKGLADPRTPLPRLFPDSGDEGLKLVNEGLDLKVSCAEEIMLDELEWHFLARWWVNGMSHVPELPGQGKYDVKRFYSGRHPFGKQLLFGLNFDPSLPGARKGDRIEVQLLYCDLEWQYIGIVGLAGFHSEGTRVLLSNRVAFVAP